MTISVKRIVLDDNLTEIAERINAAQWDAANDVGAYDAESLFAYLSRQDTVFVVAFEKASEESGNHGTFLGMASGRIEIKPYDRERWLYVDEVDVCVDQRKKGAGKAIMQKLFDIAEEEDCEEVWLGTEDDNDAANALYKSLSPDDVGEVVGYTWELDE